MTKHEEIQSRLNDFVDGELPPAERSEVRDHLDGCELCRGELEGLVALLADARALPREVAPPRDLWDGIAARLQDRSPAARPEAASTPVIAVDFRPASRPAWRRWAPMAAAAMVLVALSSGLTAYLVRARAETQVAVVPVPVPTAVDTRPVSALAAFRPTEQEFIGTVETLQAQLEAGRPRLAPQTVATIEENLRIIDQAIAEARAALERDPANVDLPHMLSGVYRKKVELLQSAVQLQQRSL